MIAIRHPSHVDRWLVDFSADLVEGEALDGTPTHVADDDSPAVLVLTAEGLVGTGSPEVNTQARVRITGGKHGRTYQITSTATTSNSRTLVHTWPYVVFNG